jgi:hypothetical protein
MLRAKLHESEKLSTHANDEIASLKTKFDTTLSELFVAEQFVDTARADLVALKSKYTQLTSQPGAPFYDPKTCDMIVCPVLQSNGHIVSLESVVSAWFAVASPEDGYIFRTYICPVMQQPTTLASIATQDRIRHIAQHAGIDTDSPLTFSYQVDGEWVDFLFQDQLNILAKLCTVQTMQITHNVEQIMVHRNTMALEINASFAQVHIHALCLFTHNQAV